MPRLPQLINLNLTKCSHLSELSLTRLITGSHNNLKHFTIGYSNTGLGKNSISALQSCSKLVNLTMTSGQFELVRNQQDVHTPTSLLPYVKNLLRKKTFTLQKLVLYECDKFCLETLVNSNEKESLNSLTIVHFFQYEDREKPSELSPLCKFTDL